MWGGCPHLQVDDGIGAETLHREKLQVPLEVLGVQAGDGQPVPKAGLWGAGNGGQHPNPPPQHRGWHCMNAAVCHPSAASPEVAAKSPTSICRPMHPIRRPHTSPKGLRGIPEYSHASPTLTQLTPCVPTLLHVCPENPVCCKTSPW